MKISLDLISPIVVGFFIGITIDNFFFNQAYIFGNIFGIRNNRWIYNLYKSAQKIDKNT